MFFISLNSESDSQSCLNKSWIPNPIHISTFFEIGIRIQISPLKLYESKSESKLMQYLSNLESECGIRIGIQPIAYFHYEASKYIIVSQYFSLAFRPICCERSSQSLTHLQEDVQPQWDARWGSHKIS